MNEVVYTPRIKSIDTIQPINKVNLENFLLINGEIVKKSVYATGLIDQSMYTVPEGKIFFLTCATLSMFIPNTNGAEWTKLHARVTAGADAGNILYLVGYADVNNSASVANSMTPSLPLKFDAGSAFSIENSNANVESAGTVTGYLVDIVAFYKNFS